MKRSTLKNKLDKIVSQVVRLKGRCEVCGKTSYLQPHHFYSRSDLTIRWDLDNLYCLCPSCHVLSSKFSAHKTPADFVEWAIEKRGKKWYERLKKKHQENKQWSDEELENLYKYYLNLYKKHEKDSNHNRTGQ